MLPSRWSWVLHQGQNEALNNRSRPSKQQCKALQSHTSRSVNWGMQACPPGRMIYSTNHPAAGINMAPKRNPQMAACICEPAASGQASQ